MNTTANKANYGGLAAALAAIAAFFVPDITQEVQGAITTVLVWLAVYFIPNK